MTDQVVSRFWVKVKKGGAEECWLWTASTYTSGYGQFKTPEKLMGAHRFSYQTNNGPIPKGMDVCHKCDVRRCVNPGHLFLGTRAENLMDAKEKGRMAFGSRHPMARLSDAEIESIRRDVRSGLGPKEVADRYGISKGYVHILTANRRRKI